MYKQEKPRKIHQLRQKLWKASISNFEKYINKKNNLIDKKYLEKRTCPTCKKNNYRFLLNKNGGTYVECKNCEMIFINPVFKDKYLEDYYRNNHSVRHNISLSEIKFFNFTYGKGMSLISKYFKNPGKILDVGCSGGMFLDIAKKKNWITYGLELNSTEAKIAKSKGHQIKKEMLSRANFGVKFDVICFWDVFEHIKDGYECLKICKKLLSDKGVIFMQCPSRDSLALKILQEKCNMLDGIEHVNLYGQKSLSLLCKKSKFKLLDYKTIISEIGIVNNFLDFKDPYLGDTSNVKNIFNVLSEKIMHKNKMGYKFQVCLKKL